MHSPIPHSPRSRAFVGALALVLALPLSGCGGNGDDNYARLKTAVPQSVPAVPGANVSLLTHSMPAVGGGSTEATTLLFVPKGTAPAGGWPIVAWAHGTTTVGQKACAPSLTLDALDGGLTAEGFSSQYPRVISSFVDAGYAVVAPDFEGLGAAARGPFPYYSGASESRSLIAAVKAARQASAGLSSQWAAVGHSEGGRGVLALQNYLGEAPELSFKGTVAFAPYTSLAASVRALDQRAVQDPAHAGLYAAIQNLFVGMFTTALRVGSPGVDSAAFMGADLAALLPVLHEGCIFSAFGAIATAVAAKPPGEFAGFKGDWAEVPAMRDFLAANDPAVMPGFRLSAPTLIAQGTDDVFVLEPLATALATTLAERGSPVTYRKYPGADHGTIVIDAGADALAFLAARFGR